MTNRIVQILIDKYKEDGVSLNNVISDPIFTSLPLDQQIQAVQEYASIIRSGSKPPGALRLIGKSILSGLKLGAITSTPMVLMGLKDPVSRIAVISGTALAGGILGAGKGLYDYKNEVRYNDSLNARLDSMDKDKLRNAIFTIKQQRGHRSSDWSNLGESFKPIVEKNMGLGIKFQIDSLNKI